MSHVQTYITPVQRFYKEAGISRDGVVRGCTLPYRRKQGSNPLTATKKKIS